MCRNTLHGKKSLSDIMTICRLMSKHRRWQIAVCVTSNLIKVQNNLLFVSLNISNWGAKTVMVGKTYGRCPRSG
jgi:hypothetical protein